jgi:cytochrome c-type biogenesis protein CcmH
MMTVDRQARHRKLGARVVLAACLAVVLAGPLRAVTPDEMLSDPTLEARARAISQDLRCLVCQNQSIDDSNAPLAHDLRVLVRERLAAGDSDEQAVDFIVARYGNFVLLKPPVQWDTLALWFGPALLLILGAAGFGRYFRQRPAAETTGPAPFTSEEEARLEALLDGRSST